MISVIIPIYNSENYIKRCLDSLLAQVFTDFEVLLIDDGSTDSSVSICKSIINTDSRFKLFIKKNGGSASARNFGLLNAQGDYIVFVDSDDFVSPNYLQILYATMIKYDADIVQCDYQTCNDYSIKNDFINYTGKVEIYDNVMMLNDFVSKKTYVSTAVLWNKIYKKELFINLLFTEGKVVDDEYVIYKLIYKSKKIIKIHSILYFYYLSTNSQMRSRKTIRELDKIKLLEEQLLFFKENQLHVLYDKLLYRYYCIIIDCYNLIREEYSDQKELLLALKLKKKKVKTMIFNKNINITDKFLLIFRNYFYKLFKFLHRRINN